MVIMVIITQNREGEILIINLNYTKWNGYFVTLLLYVYHFGTRLSRISNGIGSSIYQSGTRFVIRKSGYGSITFAIRLKSSQ